jgi:hypothetical protein
VPTLNRALLPKNWLLLHSKADEVVPFTSSLNFMNVLRKFPVENAALKNYQGTHFSPIFEMSFNDKPLFHEEILKFHIQSRRVER